MSEAINEKSSDLNWKNVRPLCEIMRLRSGQPIVIRAVEPRDREPLQHYFETLSPASRYKRFTGASSGLSNREMDLLLHAGEQNRFAVVAEMRIDGRKIVGEMRYRFDEASGGVEFGVSVHDDRQGQGIGSALLSSLEYRAAAVRADYIYGDTLRGNAEMQGLARKMGFAFTRTPGDWRELRMIKSVHVDVAAR